MAEDRYRARRPAGHDEDYWRTAASQVLLDMLDREHAVTVSEMEARASDRTWDPTICPYRL